MIDAAPTRPEQHLTKRTRAASRTATTKRTRAASTAIRHPPARPGDQQADARTGRFPACAGNDMRNVDTRRVAAARDLHERTRAHGITPKRTRARSLDASTKRTRAAPPPSVIPRLVRGIHRRTPALVGSSACMGNAMSDEGHVRVRRTRVLHERTREPPAGPLSREPAGRQGQPSACFLAASLPDRPLMRRRRAFSLMKPSASRWS